MKKEELGFRQFSSWITDALSQHADDGYISCLMNNHKIWKVSYGTILRWIEDFRDVRERLGLRDGDRAVVLTGSTLDAFVTFLVLSVNHITAVMADAAIPDGELLPLIGHCRVSAVFADNKNAAKMLGSQQVPVLLTYGLRSCGQVLSPGNGAADRAEPTPDAVAIMFSSGTTARRKCVELSYASILITYLKIRGMDVLHTKKPERSVLEVFPMSHVSGLFSAFTIACAGLNLSTVETISSDTLVEAFKVFKPYSFGMVPKVNDLFIGKFEEALRAKHLYGIYSRLGERSHAAIRRTGSLETSRKLMKPFRSLLYNSNFSCLFSGGASGTPHTARAVQNMGIAYLDLFASTECGVYITCRAPADTRGDGSVGNVRNDPFTETVIHNPDAGGVGEIYVRTEQIMNGYYRDPEMTEAAFDAPYFKTGDLGRIDDDGYLYITGRSKESILMPNGAKVAPADLERLIAPAIPADVHYAISGVPSPEDGTDTIHLFIQTDRLSAEEQEKLRGGILSFQHEAMNQYRIDGIHFIDEIPVTSIGKPKRYLLREYALADRQEPGSADGPETKPAAGGAEGAEGAAAEKAAAMDPAAVEEKVFRIVREAAKYEKELTGLERFKEDLGMDSLTIMEMCSEIETQFSVNVGAYIGVIPNTRELTDYILDPIFAGLKKMSGDQKKKVDAYRFPVRRKALHKALFSYFRKWSRRSMDFRVEGLENVQPGRQYIFCPNHQTHFDGLFVWTALGDRCPEIDRFGCMSKAEHLDNPLTSLMMKTLGGIPVNRSGNIIDSTQRSINFIKEGNSFLLHPEGTRTRNGELGPFKEGAAKIALETGLTIIPVAISGGYEIWNADMHLPKTKDPATGKKRTLTITFCPEVRPAGRPEAEITKEIRDKIVNRLESN